MGGGVNANNWTDYKNLRFNKSLHYIITNTNDLDCLHKVVFFLTIENKRLQKIFTRNETQECQ